MRAELVRECARTAQNVPPELMAVEDKLREIHNHLRQLAGRQVSTEWTASYRPRRQIHAYLRPLRRPFHSVH